MNADTTRFAASEARKSQNTRRAKVAPLLVVGMSVRPISAETGIPIGAVHRAKRQLEKMVAQRAGQKTAAYSFQLPTSYLVKQDINGVRQHVRRLTVSVFEWAVENAIGRRLLGRRDCAEPWTVVSALFAAMFDDHTIEWLNKRGYLRWDERRRGEAIIAAVNTLIGWHR
jgi:hypothetical protein